MLRTTFAFSAAWLRAHCRTERGATLVEYVLMMALIALVCFAAIGYYGRSTGSKFSSVSTRVSNAS